MNRLKKWVLVSLCLILSVGGGLSARADGVMPKMPEPPTTAVYWHLSSVSIEPTLNQMDGFAVSYGDENVSVPLDDRLMTESLLESGDIASPSLRISAVRGNSALEQTYTWSAMPVYLEPDTVYEITLSGESRSTSATLDSWMGVYLQGETVGRLSAGGYSGNESVYTLALNPSETELFIDGSLNVSFVLRDANDMLRIRVLYAYEMVDGNRPYPTPIPGFVAAEEAPEEVPDFYVPAEGKEGLWTVVTAPDQYRAYGYMNGEGPSFFAADESGSVEMNAPVVTREADYAAYVEGFYPFAAEGEVPQGYVKISDSLYAFTSRDGVTSYRAFGRLNGAAPAFYPADENGNVTADAQAADPAADYAEHMEGFGSAGAESIPEYYQTNENGVYAFTGRDGQIRYRAYGRLNGAEPAFYECDENGVVAADAVPVVPADDFASFIEGFDVKQPEEVPAHYQQAGEGLYSFTTKEGETKYRVYGVLDGQAPAFYPADESGAMTAKEAVLPQEDFEQYFRGFEAANPGEKLPNFYYPADTEGVWSFVDTDGNVQYRTYGSKDRGENAFYPCDASGTVENDALPVEAAADLAMLPIVTVIPGMPEGDQAVDFYTLIDAEKGLYAFTGRDGQTEYRVFGTQEENGEAAYYPCDEHGVILPGSQAADPQKDYENHIAGFEGKTPDAAQLPAAYEIVRDGLYAYENAEGEKVYRAYGSLNRGEPAFYPADENGTVSSDAQPVDPQAEAAEAAENVRREVVPAEEKSGEAETVSRSYPVNDESVPASAGVAQAETLEATEEPEEATEEPEPTTEPTQVPEQDSETEEEKSESWIWIVIGAVAAALGIGGGTVAALKKKAKKK